MKLKYFGEKSEHVFFVLTIQNEVIFPIFYQGSGDQDNINKHWAKEKLQLEGNFLFEH